LRASACSDLVRWRHRIGSGQLHQLKEVSSLRRNRA
jgi:hypothetical protein